MVFNTGAALLDAIILAVVSREQQGTYGYKITQDVRRRWTFLNPLYIRYLDGYRKTNVWKFMICSLTGEIEDTIK